MVIQSWLGRRYDNHKFCRMRCRATLIQCSLMAVNDTVLCKSGVGLGKTCHEGLLLNVKGCEQSHHQQWKSNVALSDLSLMAFGWHPDCM